ncbi:YncE family protein [Niabella drilacis]|uniref:40-residue YVTN family beta-propeller repeat-containing protein n=1 Tax=Niabella drilacis (strain DSM 25811 / CCM 8410 / CCUG 62505 / LMG 26954 / E90) TaxID=1285928 RepID=A0A1G7B1R5_NIADE|nr:YncE family protein [Niabella drilacis]SDE20961.1 hypothetical protein SAMN04487894_12651 [Niabella drilacis]
MKQNLWLPVCLYLAGILLIAACRKERDWTLPPQNAEKDTTSTGFYFLNEGGWGYNNATLDYFDTHSGVYERDVFTKANPDAVLGLGDTGNDMGVYGSKLYVVMNWSKKIEILDARTARRIKVLTDQTHKAIENARSITFANGFAYLSSYTTSEKGMVLEIDTATLNVTRTVEVGRQPDELTVAGNKLYVANSGGYSPANLERTVSVIDLSAFKVIKAISVAPNLRRLKKDGNGFLYICPWGTTGKLYVVDTKTDRLADSINVMVEDFTIVRDTAYIYGTDYGGGQHAYTRVDLKNKKVIPGSFISDGTKITMPYGIAVDPNNGSIYIADARNYSEAGDLYCFNAYGKLKSTIWKTGIIPGHIAFYNRNGSPGR